MDKNVFIDKANKKHGNEYDYSKLECAMSDSNVEIVCKKHGSFWQRVSHHLSGSKCPKCSRRLSQDEFIQKAKSVHGNKYDYSLVKYEKVNQKIQINCFKHGVFSQVANSHLNGYGCPKCQYDLLSSSFTCSQDEFIQKAKDVHGDKYDYSLVKYTGCFDKIKIICKKHGVFMQTPSRHLCGGCLKCSNHISNMESKWLDIKNVPDTKENRQVILKIGNKNISVDGFIPASKTIFEFYGDFWHGNPKKFKPSAINIANKIPFGVLYKKTIERENLLIKNGFKIISIWEMDFAQTYKELTRSKNKSAVLSS